VNADHEHMSAKTALADPISDYLDGLERVVASCDTANAASHTFLEDLEQSNPTLLGKLLSARKAFMTDSDKEKASPYLPIGYFRNFSVEDRLVLFALSFEVSDRLHERRMSVRLEPYNKEHALFKAAPDLWNHVRVSGERPADLINTAALEFVSGTEFVKFGRCFAELDYGLNPGLVSWIRQRFPKSPLYLRLQPSHVFDTRPSSRLHEAIVRPIDPNWWNNLEVHPGQLTGLTVEIADPASPSDDLEAWLERHVKGIRRWEMSVKRGSPNYLSVMVEEIIHRTAGFQEVLGSCIHLDTSAPVGTAAETAKLMHLDLAVNWYPGQKGAQRLAQRLDQGMVETATRTHLLRLENIPFMGFFEITSAFLESRVLLRDWLSAQSFTTPNEETIL